MQKTLWFMHLSKVLLAKDAKLFQVWNSVALRYGFGMNVGVSTCQGTLPIPQLGMKKAGILKTCTGASPKLRSKQFRKVRTWRQTLLCKINYLYLHLPGFDKNGPNAGRPIIHELTLFTLMINAGAPWQDGGRPKKPRQPEPSGGNSQKLHEILPSYYHSLCTSRFGNSWSPLNKSHHIAREWNMYMRR